MNKQPPKEFKWKDKMRKCAICNKQEHLFTECKQPQKVCPHIRSLEDCKICGPQTLFTDEEITKACVKERPQTLSDKMFVVKNKLARYAHKSDIKQTLKDVELDLLKRFKMASVPIMKIIKKHFGEELS